MQTLPTLVCRIVVTHFDKIKSKKQFEFFNHEMEKQMTLSVTVTTDKLHMRQGAGRTFDSHTLVAKGELLSVSGTDATGT